MEKGLPDFQLTHKPAFGNDKAEATLYFRQSDQGNYFFNRYDLSIQKEESDLLKQSFYVSKDNTFTLKEAFNLLEGRSVHKELVNKEKDPYTTWVKLDFSEADKYGNFKMKHFSNFDLEPAIDKLPLKVFENASDKEQLMESLKKGNRQSVTLQHNGTDYKRSIEANPQHKTINMYDGNQRVKNQNQKEASKQSESVNEGQGKRAKNSQKESAGGDDEAPAAPEQKKRRKKSQGIS